MSSFTLAIDKATEVTIDPDRDHLGRYKVRVYDDSTGLPRHLAASLFLAPAALDKIVAEYNDATSPPARLFPPDGRCTQCEGAHPIRYAEKVYSTRTIDIDDDGSVWVSGLSEEWHEAAEDAHTECSVCLQSYALPDDYEFGS